MEVIVKKINQERKRLVILSQDARRTRVKNMLNLLHITIEVPDLCSRPAGATYFPKTQCRGMWGVQPYQPRSVRGIWIL